MDNHIACASYSEEGNTAKVIVPINHNLSVSSVILALERYKNWKLLNVVVIFTDHVCLVEYTFQDI